MSNRAHGEKTTNVAPTIGQNCGQRGRGRRPSWRRGGVRFHSIKRKALKHKRGATAPMRAQCVCTVVLACLCLISGTSPMRGVAVDAVGTVCVAVASRQYGHQSPLTGSHQLPNAQCPPFFGPRLSHSPTHSCDPTPSAVPASASAFGSF
jgi:hypothetical protein